MKNVFEQMEERGAREHIEHFNQLKTILLWNGKNKEKRYLIMKLKIFGKQGGKFINDSGDTITYRKVFAVKPAGYVDQQHSADRVVVGGEAGSYTCSQVVFDLLPDEGSEYQKGFECDVEFDDKKRIVDIRDM